MRVKLLVDGGGDQPGVLEKELSAYLDSQQQLRGRVHLTTERRQTSGMTQSIITIIVELGPAAVGGLAGALVTWIRYRTSNTRLTVHRPDGSRIELAAQRVRRLDPDQITELVKQLRDAVDDSPPKPLPTPPSQPEITS
ncbi:effector-associated constant component EACC1 [Actinoplanes aureus]|nr:hypothetical protein [Actinoplanes aureus]